MQKLSALILAPAVAAVLAAGAQAQPLQPALELRFGQATLVTEVARTEAEQKRGLMFRTDITGDRGMVFPFDRPQRACMWMKDTVLALSAAFIAADGTVVNIEEMKPLTLTRHCARLPVLWVVEAPQGWFVRHAVRPGQAVQGLPAAR